MALVSCRECSSSVSSEAATCPHCGISQPAVAAPDFNLYQLSEVPIWVWVLIAALMVAGALYFYSQDDDLIEPTLSQQQCRKDLRCWAEQNNAKAAGYCQRHIENLGQYSHKWDSGLMNPRFSHYRWKNESAGEITYVGDRINFQNGFGAMQKHIYECDMSSDGNTVLSVRAYPGSL